MASPAASLFLGGYVATDDGAGHVKMSTRASETMMGLRSGDAGHTLVLLPHSRRLLACSSPSLTTRAMATNDDNLQRQQQKDSTSLSASTSRSGWPQPPMAGISSLIDYWDPFNFGTRSLRQVMDTMDKLFETSSIGLQDTTPYIRSPWDIIEEEDCYHMRIDLPGFEKDEVKVQLEENVFVVQAEHKATEVKDKWRTRTHGKYRTRIALPDIANTSKITAKLDKGVLDVSIPKVKKEKKLLDVKVD